jgi:hypothetical protein
LAQAIFEPNLSPYKYCNIFKPSHPSYISAYEDGTVCSETSAYKIQTRRNYPEESIQHSEHGESLKSTILFTSMGVKLQDTFVYSKNSTSRKPNSSLPSLFSFATNITTPYLVSYNSITTSASELPTEYFNKPVLPYSGKGYITTDENVITITYIHSTPIRL